MTAPPLPVATQLTVRGSFPTRSFTIQIPQKLQSAVDEHLRRVVRVEAKRQATALGCSRSDLRGRGIRTATSAVECTARRSRRSEGARRVCRSSCPEKQTAVSASTPQSARPTTMTLFTSLVRAVSLRSTQKCRKTWTNGCCHPGRTSHFAVDSLRRTDFHLAKQSAFVCPSPSHTAKSTVMLTNGLSRLQMDCRAYKWTVTMGQSSYLLTEPFATAPVRRCRVFSFSASSRPSAWRRASMRASN